MSTVTWTSEQIREEFLSYFEGHGHLRVASSSLIPVGDPTLLLTNAGMVQFKPYFAGETTPPNRRLTSSQKSFRTPDIDIVGDATHNTMFEMLGNFSIGDYFKKEAIAFALEFLTQNMGLPKDRLHATIYLDDDEARDLWIQAGVPDERIFRFGDQDNWWGPAGLEGPCGPCSEIHYDFGQDQGCGQPGCGPNCENAMNEHGDVCDRFVELWNLVFMQFYHHLDGTRTPLPSTGVDTGMGFERLCRVMQGASTMYETDLFQPMVGRVAEISGVRYGADRAADHAIRTVAEHGRSVSFLIADGVVPGNEGRGYVLRRVIRRAMRYGRSIGLEGSFLGGIAEATIEKMGDVYPELRANQEFILTVLGLEEERFNRALTTGLGILTFSLKGWRDEMRGAFEDQFRPEIDDALRKADVVDISHGVQAASEKFLKGRFIMHVLGTGERDAIDEAQAEVAEGVEQLKKTAEGRLASDATLEPNDDFAKRLRQAFDTISSAIDDVTSQISGFESFVLSDTYGFPVEETQAIARDLGISEGVDISGFEREMQTQRERSRATAQFGGDRAKIRVYESLGVGGTRFLGYDTLTASSVVVGLIAGDEAVNRVTEGQEVEVALVQTPFYAEGGGQVGDAGEIVGPGGRIEVSDTQLVMPELIVQFGRVAQGTVEMGDAVDAYVDPVRRQDTARNHTATHMLHAALRQVLGAHVRQAGSLVAPDRLRFDFTHVQPVTDEEMWQVQLLVNEKVRHNAIIVKDEDTYQSAIRRGALAFFGDKYGDTVRLIEIANGETFSFEVCGGTHVERTGEVGSVYVLGEASIGAGMRRIEAISGRAAERLVWERFQREDRLARTLQTSPQEIEDRVRGLLDEIDTLQRDREAVERRLSLQSAEGLLSLARQVDGVTVLATRANAANADSLREVGDWLRDKLGSGIVVLGSVINDRPMLVAMVTPDLVERGLDAAEIARGAARAIGGGGGGRADVAQAGGRDADSLDDALGLVPDLVREKIGP